MDLEFISHTSEVIKTYRKNRLNGKYQNQEDEILKDLCWGITKVLYWWTSDTYVGTKKEHQVEEAFQKFFLSLKKLIDTFYSNKKILTELEQDFLQSLRYQGELYRYIGTKTQNKKHPPYLPENSNIYVSWSKKPDNHYILSKLTGKITMLFCIVDGYNYGIDIAGYNEFYDKICGEHIMIAKGTELEVVFPTITDIIDTTIIKG